MRWLKSFTNFNQHYLSTQKKDVKIKTSSTKLFWTEDDKSGILLLSNRWGGISKKKIGSGAAPSEHDKSDLAKTAEEEKSFDELNVINKQSQVLLRRRWIKVNEWKLKQLDDLISWRRWKKIDNAMKTKAKAKLNESRENCRLRAILLYQPDGVKCLQQFFISLSGHVWPVSF